MYKILLWALVLSGAASCAPSRFVKPLEKHQKAVNLSLGGPLVALNNVSVPVPFVTAVYGYGVTSSTTAFGALNLTSAVYGNIQLELGATKSLLKQQGAVPGVSIMPAANIIYRHSAGTKLYPQLDANAYWNFHHNRNLLYVGISNWFELASKRASGLTQPNHWLLTPMVGHSFIRKKGEFTVEFKVIAPGLKNNNVPVDYKTPVGTHGAFGIYFGYTRKF